MTSFASGSINFEKVTVEGDLATVTLTIPYASISLLKNLLDSLASFSSFLHLKARHNKALTRSGDVLFQEEREKRYQILSSNVMASFNKHYDRADYRAAVKAVKSELVKMGYSVTCGVLENIIKDNKK